MATNEHPLFSTDHFGEIVVIRIVIEMLYEERTVRRLFDELIEAIGERSHVVLDLEQVHHVSSITLSKLVQVNRRLKNRGGELVLSHLKQKVYAAFRTSNLDRLFKITSTLEEALAALSWSLTIDCPIAECGGNALTHDASIADRGGELRCRSCGCRFCVAPFQLSSGGVGQIEVTQFEVPTYEQEQIRAELGIIVQLSIVGRLDLFTAEALVDAWQPLRASRRALLDLRAATELSEAGLRFLDEQLRDSGSQTRVIVMVDSDRFERTCVALSGMRVMTPQREAASVFGDSPGSDEKPAPLLVSARTLQSPANEPQSRATELSAG